MVTENEMRDMTEREWENDAQELEFLRAELRATRAALVRYGRHSEQCEYEHSVYPDWPCSCGLQQALDGEDVARD